MIDGHAGEAGAPAIPARTGGRFTVRLLALVLLLVALPIAAGGIWLLIIGGSAYYAAGGLIVIAAAVLLWRSHSAGGLLYCAFLAATIGWALWEAGLDGWALAPRLVGPGLLGLFFFLPAVGRAIGKIPALASGIGGVMCLGLTVLAAILPGNYGPGRLDTQIQLSGEIAGSDNAGQWRNFGRTAGGDRFSPLDQINQRNVAGLKPAWTYHTGVLTPDEGGGPLQTTPIMVGDSLYLCTQTNVVIALDPDTGREKWRFDPKVNATGASRVTTCRGVAYFEDLASTDCPRRIIATTFDVRLLAIDAQTGKPCLSFGDRGAVDLRAGMGDVSSGFYYASSAPVIAGGNIVLGGWVADNQSTDEPSGVIRAFDARSGAFRWAWDAGRPGHYGEPPKGEVYTRSTPNSWAPMSADEKLGLVYVPTGNATPDHWGGNRSEESKRYGSSVVALDMNSGQLRWSFQTTHYDVWDYDVASQPTLLDVTIGGRKIPALIQATKRGEVFVLDRRNGKPLAPVEERAVPQRGSAEVGRLSPTQPFSTGMPSLAGDPLRERDMWGMTPFDQLWCRIAFRKLRYDGSMTPPGTEPSLIYPGIAGGVNWGSVSIDPMRQVMIVNSMQYGSVIRLVPRAETDRLLAHGANYSHSFVLPQPQAGTPYGVQLQGFESPLLAPCNKPPYGNIHAIDLKTGKRLWSRPFGSIRDTGPFNIPLGLPLDMGMPNFGGSLVTASGLVFIGASHDSTFRAFDINTGKNLWQARLPAGGQANPMSFRSPRTGRQFVVIAAGGHKLLRASPGDAIVAFALPVSD